jgi:hypothetical protein
MEYGFDQTLAVPGHFVGGQGKVIIHPGLKQGRDHRASGL